MKKTKKPKWNKIFKNHNKYILKIDKNILIKLWISLAVRQKLPHALESPSRDIHQYLAFRQVKVHDALPTGPTQKSTPIQRFTASVTPAPQPHPKRHPRPLLLSLYTIFQLSSFTTRFPSPRFPRPRFLSLKPSLSLSTNYPLPSLHQLFRVSINL